MRKTISLMIAVAILLSMGLSSAAAEPAVSKSGAVQANYVAGTKDSQIISVDIDWKNMEFTYHDKSEAVWDPVNHAYGEAKAAAWEQSEAYISITNHSNVILQANITYAAKDKKYEDMWLRFTNEFPYIGSAYTAEGKGEPCNVTIRTIPDGTLIPDVSTGTEVGEIKVTMAPVDDYGMVLDGISSMYADYSPKNDNHNRGDICYATQADLDRVTSCYAFADKVINKEPGEKYEMNAALNALIVAYYNNLYFVQ